MKTFLDQMKGIKLAEIERDQQTQSLNNLRQQIESLDSPVPFGKSLQRQNHEPLSIIAELKSKAPGRTNVQEMDVLSVIRDYEAGGADAISVLTDASYFGGSLETLEFARNHTDLPLLHKEFVIDEYQLLQGRIRGASGVLILVYYFNQYELAQMLNLVHSIGLEAVVECSLPEELPRALAVNPDILLLNNRPIASIPENPTKSYTQGSVDVSVEWWQTNQDLQQWKSQPSKVLISASCIDQPAQVQQLFPLPFDAILVGNAAMIAPDRSAFLKGLQVTHR